MNPDKESSGKPTVEELIKENQSQREQLKKAQAEIERLRKLLEEALRSLKRQAAPVTDFRRSGSSAGASGSAGVDPGGASEQTDGDFSRACGSGFGMGLWIASQPQRALPGADPIGQEGGADVSRTSDRRPPQFGQSAR